jgi:hypothetical protein
MMTNQSVDAEDTKPRMESFDEYNFEFQFDVRRESEIDEMQRLSKNSIHFNFDNEDIKSINQIHSNGVDVETITE